MPPCARFLAHRTFRIPAAGQHSPRHDGWLRKPHGATLADPFFLDVDGDGVDNLLRYDETLGQYLALNLVAESDLTASEREFRDDPFASSCDLFPDNCDPSKDDNVPVLPNMVGRWVTTGLKLAGLSDAVSSSKDRLKVVDINGDGLPDVVNSPVFSTRALRPDDVCKKVPGLGVYILQQCLAVPSWTGSLESSGYFPIEHGEPAEVWINRGGRFELKPMVTESDWRGGVSCDVKLSDGSCATRFSTMLFPMSMAMDYDNDGLGDLLSLDPTSAEEAAWSVVTFKEKADRIEASFRKVNGFPESHEFYFFMEEGTFRRSFTYPVWSDLNGDSELDVMLVGLRPNQKTLYLGTNGRAGARLTGVTDSLSNSTTIHHQVGSDVVSIGDCDGRADPIPELAPESCVTSVGGLVSAVERADSTGTRLDRTTYRYANPRRAPFFGGLQ